MEGRLILSPTIEMIGFSTLKKDERKLKSAKEPSN
jgi:hypothetical protein